MHIRRASKVATKFFSINLFEKKLMIEETNTFKEFLIV